MAKSTSFWDTESFVKSSQSSSTVLHLFSYYCNRHHDYEYCSVSVVSRDSHLQNYVICIHDYALTWIGWAISVDCFGTKPCRSPCGWRCCSSSFQKFLQGTQSSSFIFLFSLCSVMKLCYQIMIILIQFQNFVSSLLLTLQRRPPVDVRKGKLNLVSVIGSGISKIV